MAWNSVVETNSYLADAMRLLTDDEREAVIDTLAQNPTAGVLVRGLGGLRKMRIGIGGRGKRGGGRVVYWFHSPAWPVVLLAMFAKNEAADLTPKQRATLARVADQVMSDFRRTR